MSIAVADAKNEIAMIIHDAKNALSGKQRLKKGLIEKTINETVKKYKLPNSIKITKSLICQRIRNGNIIVEFGRGNGKGSPPACIEHRAIEE
mmetsp:Transcript_626/g.687  ORF Transcript_626/g.687 Transcript_626/m.687 type:complete len:92 (-) Transcript_626:272-547(-)